MIPFGADDWARIRRDYTAWWEHSLDRPLIYFAAALADDAPPDRPAPLGFLPCYPPETTDAQLVGQYVRCESARTFPGDTFPFFFVNYGAGIAAAFLGCRVNPRPETVWFAPAEGAGLTDLPRFDPDNVWWRRVEAMTRTAVEMLGESALVSYTDLGGNLDVLASLVGTEPLLMDILDRPADVARAAQAVRAAWLEAFNRLDAIIRSANLGVVGWAPIWAPGRTYMMQSDISYMLSPQTFAELVAPDIQECCRRIEYGFYHLDGVGQIGHLDHLLRIERLRGIQWIPGDGKPPAEHWPDLLRRIRDAGKLVQVYTSAAGANGFAARSAAGECSSPCGTP